MREHKGTVISYFSFKCFSTSTPIESQSRQSVQPQRILSLSRGGKSPFSLSCHMVSMSSSLTCFQKSRSLRWPSCSWRNCSRAPGREFQRSPRCDGRERRTAASHVNTSLLEGEQTRHHSQTSLICSCIVRVGSRPRLETMCCIRTMLSRGMHLD